MKLPLDMVSKHAFVPVAPCGGVVPGSNPNLCMDPCRIHPLFGCMTHVGKE